MRAAELLKLCAARSSLLKLRAAAARVRLHAAAARLAVRKATRFFGAFGLWGSRLCATQPEHRRALGQPREAGWMSTGVPRS